MIDYFDHDEVIGALFSAGREDLHIYSRLATRAMQWGIERGLIEQLEESRYRLTPAGRKKYAKRRK
ncbi:MAG TPA: hypothetical protein VF077_03840 [Nitrospiraceae bacterium]